MRKLLLIVRLATPSKEHGATLITRIQNWAYPAGKPRLRTVPRPAGWSTNIQDEQRWHRIIRRASLTPTLP